MYIYIYIPLIAVLLPLGVISPSSARTGELGSSIRTSGVSALLCCPLEGEDRKNIGDDDGGAPSSLNRLAARGVVWKFPDWGVGLLVGGF